MLGHGAIGQYAVGEAKIISSFSKGYVLIASKGAYLYTGIVATLYKVVLTSQVQFKDRVTPLLQRLRARQPLLED